MAQIATMRDRPCAIKDRIRELEGQLDETLQSLRMEKALVSGELHEEENMLEIESSQLENNIRGDRQGSCELAKELEMTLRDRKRRVDALKVGTTAKDNIGLA
jgi:regulator of replication initiation timing